MMLCRRLASCEGAKSKLRPRGAITADGPAGFWRRSSGRRQQRILTLCTESELCAEGPLYNIDATCRLSEQHDTEREALCTLALRQQLAALKTPSSASTPSAEPRL